MPQRVKTLNAKRFTNNMEHETDYQRARRQRTEVKKHGVTGSTPRDAVKRIKSHTEAKHKGQALRQKINESHKKGETSLDYHQSRSLMRHVNKPN